MPSPKQAYAAGYLAMVDRAPELWGAFYRASDRKPPRGLKEKLVHAFDRIEFAGFRDAVQMFRPDAVVATHFLPAQVFAPARQRGRARFRFGLVMTDFDVHAFWVQPGADLTCVATEELRAVLVDRGVPSDRVVATGIPILPAFSVPNDRRMIRAALGIRDEKPAILVMGGGSGVGSMLDAVAAARDAGNVHGVDLAVSAPPGAKLTVNVVLQAVWGLILQRYNDSQDAVFGSVVAGRNPALERRLRTLAPPAGGTLTAFGFVSNVHELMAAADLAVTKSGGLTTSECLASGLPMGLVRVAAGIEDTADLVADVLAAADAVASSRTNTDSH